MVSKNKKRVKKRKSEELAEITHVPLQKRKYDENEGLTIGDDDMKENRMDLAQAGTSTELPISVGVHQWSALSALLFVDVITGDYNYSSLDAAAQEWCDRLALLGRKLNGKKTEYLTTDVNEHGSIKINGTELSRVTSFKYLGSTVTSDGSLKLEVNARVTVVRSVVTYGAECWPVTKEIESRLSVMETKVLKYRVWTAFATTPCDKGLVSPR
ncbi:unnamed protein product [Heligmosomoides polygyrus]|uniref:Reverse transcriptase domain-containing protein n=1 Tax=Heligmosomoides polygyrus TaxID=6339 RepID=A0A183FY63_HELPZ|nr:unnamed protein product [Heligmosomoides polygyrus]